MHIYSWLWKTCSISIGLGYSFGAWAQQRPNLLVVMADQYRGDAMGFVGKEKVRTPHFDSFAEQAIVLRQAVSGYPVSSPARGMFLSGAYPHVNGVLANCQSQTASQNVELRKDIECWSDILADEGYATAYIGKWHLDKPQRPYIDCANNRGATAWNEWCSPDRRHGFDYWVAYGTYDHHLRPLYWAKDSGREDFYYVNQWGPEYEADLAISYLDSMKLSRQPFAMMVSMNPPHTAYEFVPDKYKSYYQTLDVDSIAKTIPHLLASDKKHIELFKKSLANYYACITGVDEQFGRIVDALKRNGQYENTIVVFVSDHGDSMGMHKNIGKNIFYEEAMRIPFLIAYGHHWQPRVDDELLISLEDFCPSILSLMELTHRIPWTVQTRDLSNQIKGSRSDMPEYQLYMKYGAVGTNGKNPLTGARGLRNGQYTYAIYFKDGKITEEFLYDRLNDPSQLCNIADDCPEILSLLKEELRRRLVEIEDPASVVVCE